MRSLDIRQRLVAHWELRNSVASLQRKTEKSKMNIEELKKQFIVDEDVLKARLEPIVVKALAHCRIDKNGQVLITNAKLSGKQQVWLTLAARAIGSQMDSTISPQVSVVEISKFTGLPANQVRARGKDAIENKFA